MSCSLQLLLLLLGAQLVLQPAAAGRALLRAPATRPASVAAPADEHEMVQRRPSLGCTPQEVHLSFGHPNSKDRRATTMIVAWRTDEPGCTSQVYYGRAGESVSSQPDRVAGSMRTTTHLDMCGSPASDKPFTVHTHTATISGLAPGSRYWYRVEGGERQFTFATPPDARADRFSFLSFGDMGESEKGHKCPGAADTARAMEKEMQRSPIDFVLSVGDLAYADGRHTRWELFMDAIEPVSSRVPYLVSIGNHDYDYESPNGSKQDPSGAPKPWQPSWYNSDNDSGGECGAMAVSRFRSMPAAADANPPFWYSYDYANTHFTIISTEHDIAPESAQYKWLQQDLAAVDRCATPWVVVSLHRPIYVVWPHHDNREVGEHLRALIEPLLIQFEVDVTIAGHVHTYYRTCQVQADVCRGPGLGTTHFIAGTGGHVLTSNDDTRSEWLEASVEDWGFMRFDVSGNSMRAQFIRASTGEVADEVELVARRPRGKDCRAALQAAAAAAAPAAPAAAA